MTRTVPTDGRCGEPVTVPHQQGTVPNPGWSTYCELPHGHAGCHRDDLGTEWNTTQPAVAAMLDAAMHSVWLHGKWRYLTEKMTTDERKAAADAVDRYQAVLDEASRERGIFPAAPLDPAHLRWWR